MATSESGATVQHVQQTHPYGCAIACVAMVTGRPYDEVAVLIGPKVMEGFRGIDWMAKAELLHRFGYASVLLYPRDQLTQEMREPWPPRPFAPAHIVTIETPTAYHAVVWLPEGTVLDPNRPGRYRLSDYGKVLHVIGAWPIDPRTNE